MRMTSSLYQMLEKGLELKLTLRVKEEVEKLKSEIIYQRKFLEKKGYRRYVYDLITRVNGPLKKELGNHKGKPINCAKGCSFCCHIAVDITEAEAKFLVELHADKIDQGRFFVQRDQKDENFSKLPYYARKCIFLKENECSIYTNRPMSCRKYLVTGPPEECNSELYPEGIVENYGSLKTEIIASAALNIQSHGLMANMISKELRK